jgi:hypothetical protein
VAGSADLAKASEATTRTVPFHAPGPANGTPPAGHYVRGPEFADCKTRVHGAVWGALRMGLGVVSTDHLAAERRPRLVELVDEDREDDLALADGYLQETLDVDAGVGELTTELGRLTGLVRDLDLQCRALGELDAGTFQGGADGGLIAGGEENGAVIASHHAGQLEVDAALRADVSEVRKLPRLVLQLDAEQVHRNLLPTGNPYVFGNYSGDQTTGSWKPGTYAGEARPERDRHP